MSDWIFQPILSFVGDWILQPILSFGVPSYLYFAVAWSSELFVIGCVIDIERERVCGKHWQEGGAAVGSTR